MPVDLRHQRVEAELLLVVEHRAQVMAETVAHVAVGVARVLPELVGAVTALLEEGLDLGMLVGSEADLLRESFEQLVAEALVVEVAGLVLDVERSPLVADEPQRRRLLRRGLGVGVRGLRRAGPDPR